jgi:hypothetical protein
MFSCFSKSAPKKHSSKNGGPTVKVNPPVKRSSAASLDSINENGIQREPSIKETLMNKDKPDEKKREAQKTDASPQENKKDSLPVRFNEQASMI